MAPTGAEVYVDDERHGSIGRSGRVILTSIPPGKHVLRVAHGGDEDDERVIEIRPDAEEQIIQAQFKSTPSSGLSPSQGGSLGDVSGVAMSAPLSSSAPGALQDLPLAQNSAGVAAIRRLKPSRLKA